MANKKTPRKKKKTSGGTSKHSCGKCGKGGHNARKCPNDITIATASIGRIKEQVASTKTELTRIVGSISTSIDAYASKAEEEIIKIEAEDFVFPLDDKAEDTIMEEENESVEDSFDFGDENQADSDVEAIDPSEIPPGADLDVPKRKRKRSKAEQAFWAATEKKLAPDSVAEATELAMDLPRISTGNFSLDVAMYGGVPQGRISRFWGMPKSGKTGSCLNVVATYQREHCSECYQKTCKCKDRDTPDVVWVDAENRMSSMLYWPAAHGINLDCFRILAPATGQNVVDFVDHIIRSEATAKVGLIVVDSIANIVSMDELAKPTLDGVTVGRNAYLMNQAWKRWTSAVHSLGIKNERKPTILCINQIRNKVGVMWGCERGDTVIPFVDGTSARIKDIVDKKISKKVWGYNEKLNKIEPANIINWFNNGKVDSHDDWVHIKTSAVPDTKNGRADIIVTPNHKVMTERGWIRASDVSVKDKLLSRVSSRLNASLGEFVAGISAGDSSISSSGKHDGFFSFIDSSNEDYTRWKVSKLSKAFTWSETKVAVDADRTATKFNSSSSRELGQFLRKLNRRREFTAVADKFGPLSLAMWYMENGSYCYGNRKLDNVTISCKRFRGDDVQCAAIIGTLAKLGITANIHHDGTTVYIPVTEHQKFFETISRFVPTCMAFKLPPEYRNDYDDFTLQFEETQEVIYISVTSVGSATFKHGLLDKYDIEVEGCHSFLAGNNDNGFLTHNSPEVMPGGIGQDFATSVDVRFSSGPPTYVIFDEKKQQWIAKQKKSGSNFKPPADASPDFITVNYRVTASGICPGGRYGEFNYWQKSAHGHRCGDPDNGLQLWQYAKRYNMIDQHDGQKHLAGHSARTLDELKDSFRSDRTAHTAVREVLMKKLLA